MATYCVSTLVNDPSDGDRLMYIYNCSSVLVMTIDPYSSSFYSKGAYIYIMTDGRLDYNNLLDFASSSEAESGVIRLNQVKQIFIDDTNSNLEVETPLSTFYSHTGNTDLHITATERLALDATTTLSASNPFATISDVSGFTNGNFTTLSATTCNVETIEINTQSETSFIMKDVYDGTRYKMYISDGTLTYSPV